MITMQGHAETRWLPSRFHFAVFRLFAFMVLSTRDVVRTRDSLLMVNRDQTAFEHYAVSIWITLTIACYLAADISVFAAPLAVIVIQILVVIIALLFRNARVNSIAFMSLMTIAAAYYATHASWARFVAWQFLGILALNAIAAVIVFLLRAAIAKREAVFVS